jgi:signal transduction histidine kinase
METILAAGSSGSVANQKEPVARALAALGDVDESIAGIRSSLRTVFRTPAADALDQSIARFRYEHGDKGISLVLPPDSPVAEGVFISPVAFDKILEALLSNSARATEGRTDAAIEIEIQWEGDYCKIDVRDNGCGIPREDWERAFERSYTTKEEGGFGLYYARETLARFGGKIFVLDSVVGSATTMRIVLRKS